LVVATPLHHCAPPYHISTYTMMSKTYAYIEIYTYREMSGILIYRLFGITLNATLPPNLERNPPTDPSGKLMCFFLVYCIACFKAKVLFKFQSISRFPQSCPRHQDTTGFRSMNLRSSL
jgi:hypothetical protein